MTDYGVSAADEMNRLPVLRNVLGRDLVVPRLREVGVGDDEPALVNSLMLHEATPYSDF